MKKALTITLLLGIAALIYSQLAPPAKGTSYLQHKRGAFRSSGSYLLDDYGSASAAYSLRQLSSSFTGDVIKARRGGDDVESGFTAAEIADGSLVTWAGEGLGDDNAYVKEWFDQSGNLNDATQLTDASQPQIVSSGALITENGETALSFASDYLSIDSMPITTNRYVICAVVNFETLQADEMLFSAGGSNFLEIRRKGGTNALQILGGNSTNNDFGTAGINSVQRLIFAQRPSTTVKVYMDGTEDISFTLAADGTPTGNDPSICSRNGSFFLSGKLQEIIFWDSDESANRSGIESNVNSYFSIY